MPLHIVAHELADHYAQHTGEERFSFAHYREDGPHDVLAGTFVRCLEYVKGLSSAQVEHQRLSHGLVIASAPPEAIQQQKRYPDDLSAMKRTPLLADGFRSLFWVSPDGRPVNMITRHGFDQQFGPPPHKFGALSLASAVSERYEGVAIVLRPEGSIATFVGGEPLFIRRGEQWTGLLWSAIRGVMVERWGDVGEIIFDAALSLATAGKGGILSIAEEPSPQLSQKDRVDVARGERTSDEGNDYSEWVLHNMLPSENVLDLGEEALAMLASIDGATVVSAEGDLVTYGAIVPSEPSAEEGARATAARALSTGSFVIEISEDGPIKIFEDEKEILEL